MQPRHPHRPHAGTFHRALERVDVEAGCCDRVAGFRASLPTGDLNPIALNGKTLRGAWTADDTQVHLRAAMVHKEGIVLAQRDVPPDTDEITQVRLLLEDLDLADPIVTADVFHTQRDHAEPLVAEKGADYVFTVNGNQRSLRATIGDRFDGPFFASPPDH